MKPKAFKGYGDMKQWYWGARSDVCVSSGNSVLDGVIYVTPWTQDTPMIINNPLSFRWKWSYQIADFWGDTEWTINFHIGVYKMLKGTGGVAGTLEKIPTNFIYNWSGVGPAGPNTVYDGSTSLGITATGLGPITDGALYTAMLWVVEFSALGPIALITSYGSPISSGTWLYDSVGLVAQTALPQTINALAASAKTFQEHWIAIN